MSFVKSILQQWRDRNLKKNTYSDSEQLIVSDIPGTDIAEQHLLGSSRPTNQRCRKQRQNDFISQRRDRL